MVNEHDWLSVKQSTVVCFRGDKERQQMAVEIETVTSMLETTNKAKVEHTTWHVLVHCATGLCDPALSQRSDRTFIYV